MPFVDVDRALAVPGSERAAVVEWVQAELGDLIVEEVRASDIRGGQQAANEALARFDVAGYAASRNEVWPQGRRGASMLSPFIRHGLLTLPEVWSAVEGGPEGDVLKFRDELLWQEYARHVYARLGRETGRSLRHAVAEHGDRGGNPWSESGRCVEASWEELRSRGWITNQQRMWMASHWSVRRGQGWRDGEDLMFARLLDGSRAANRIGWQWTVGALTGRPYGFSRSQVEHRAPGLCAECRLADACPIEQWPEPVEPARLDDPDPRLRSGPVDEEALRPQVSGEPSAVWLTAESLGDADPAMRAHPDLPAVFVFDVALLRRLRLAGPRMVFIAESVAELATRRSVEIWRGDPVSVLRGRRVAATSAPVPGWARRAREIQPVARYPWPWLRVPAQGPVSSFSAWRRGR